MRLGHRRRLQREIANYKGIPFEQVITSPGRASSNEVQAGDVGSGQHRNEVGQPTTGTGKRRYRRHPKADSNAPERSPSAYVLFSNEVRDELKSQNLSFTDMAKVVGERWQQLDTDGREPYESNANNLKEKYNNAMAEYKKTDEFKEYAEYLARFKASQQAAASGQGNEGKRLKLERSGDGSHGSSRGSQGTPTTSAHGSPINISTSIMQSSMDETAAASPTSTPGYAVNYPPPMSGRAGAGSAARSLVIGQTPPEAAGTYAPQLPLPPISIDNSQRNLPRRSNNPAAPFLSHTQDGSTQSSSQRSGGSHSSGGYYSPMTPVEPVPRIGSATSTEAGTPFGQHHGLRNLSITALQDHQSSGGLSGQGQPSISGPAHHPFSAPETASRTLPPLSSHVALPPPQSQQRLDGLSVLALAGRLVDAEGRESHSRPPRTQPP